MAYRYLAENILLENQSLKVINELRGSVRNLESRDTSQSRWQSDSIEGTISSLESSLSSLLIKAGQYDIALNILKENNGDKTSQIDAELVRNLEEIKKAEDL